MNAPGRDGRHTSLEDDAYGYGARPAAALLYAGEMELDSASIEGALRSLWSEAAESAEGRAVARVRVLNLVAYTEDDATTAFADQVMSALPERHPCRGLLLEVDPQGDAPLRASVSARCLVASGGARKVCSEVITVRAGATSRARLVDAVTPLLVADLPVVFWWSGRPRPADPLFRRFGSGLADRVLVDSAAFRDPGSGLIALSRWLENPRCRATLGDLAWERLRSWRQVLANTVDAPEARRQLARIDRVTIRHAGSGAPTEEALLAAGWVTACFRWVPEDSPAHGVVTLRSVGGGITMRFEPTGSDHQPLVAIRLETRDGASFSVEAGDHGTAVCVTRTPDAAAVERTVPLPERDEVTLFIDALGRSASDPVYDAALTAAAEIATLGTTA